MKAKTFFFVHAVFIIFFFCAFVPPVSAAELPRAQLDEAERHFTEAYRRFLARDHWGALDFLDRALKANTYLVDYYLMRGLVMNRTGAYGAGREALEHYLEVRTMDFTAPRILSYSIAQQRSLQRIVSPASLSVQWQISMVDLQNELDLGYIRVLNTKGLGKADMWGKSFYLADTLGDSVIYRKKSAREIRTLNISRPAAVLPTGDDSFYIVTAGGEIYYVGAFTDEPELVIPELKGVLENTDVIDAAMISENEFAVADPTAREIAFYSFAVLGASNAAALTDVWSPPDEGGAFFEPVAAAAYGQWMAVADRGGSKIFFLNTGDRGEFFSADVPFPRDVLWSSLGELFVINEEGGLFKVTADFRDGRVEAVDELESGITEGWTLFGAPEGDIYCLDIAASRLWKAVAIPDVNLSVGVFSSSSPTVTREENMESFLVDATLMSPFKTYSKMSAIVAHAVWNNRTIPSTAEWTFEKSDTAKTDVILFTQPAQPGTVNPAINSAAAENGLDVRIALPSIWSSRGNTLTNVIIDSTIDMNQEDLNVITLFCMNNGVELDVWARSAPTVEMTRAAALTGGKTLFSLVNEPDLSPPQAKMQIRIPLPHELSSSGYPGRSMLSLFLDVGLMQTRDWIPLWPDMIE